MTLHVYVLEDPGNGSALGCVAVDAERRWVRTIQDRQSWDLPGDPAVDRKLKGMDSPSATDLAQAELANRLVHVVQTRQFEDEHEARRFAEARLPPTGTRATASLERRLALLAQQTDRLAVTHIQALQALAPAPSQLVAIGKELKILREELSRIAGETPGGSRASRAMSGNGDGGGSSISGTLGGQRAMPDGQSTAVRVEVTITRGGYATRRPADVAGARPRVGRKAHEAASRADDPVLRRFICSTQDWVVAFTDSGRAYRAKAHQLPEAPQDGNGQRLAAADEQVIAAWSIRSSDEKPYIVMATQKGIVKKTPLNEYRVVPRGGARAIDLTVGDRLVDVSLAGSNDQLLLVTRSGMALRFSAGPDLRPRERSAAGVHGIRLYEHDEVLSLNVLPADSHDELFLLTMTAHGFAKRTAISEYRAQARGGLGVQVARWDLDRGPLVGALVVREQDEVVSVHASGTLTRHLVSAVRVTGRRSMGALLAPAEGDRMISLFLAPPTAK